MAEINTNALQLRYEQFPLPVALVALGKLQYCNPPAAELFSVGEDCPAALLPLVNKLCDEAVYSQEAYQYRVSAVEQPEGSLLLFQPMATGNLPKDALLSSLSTQLRMQLQTLTAATESMHEVLQPTELFQKVSTPLAVQAHSICQLLRHTHLLELTQMGWETEYPQTPLSLSHLLSHIGEAIAPFLKQTNYSFDLKLPPFEVFVQGNAVLLEQLIFSLLSNAMKAVPENNTGVICLRLSATDTQAYLSMSDQGSGIAEEQLPHLFSAERPHRLPRGGEGLGLGLYLAHQIARFHKGTLLSSAEQEQGATLLLSLPRIPAVSLPLRDSAGTAPARKEQLSPLLVALSDALPWKLFSSLWNP